MVRKKSLNAIELDTQLSLAVLGVQEGLYKSLYTAAKALGLRADTIQKRVYSGLLCSQAR